MITDSFEIDGREVGIHIVENKNDNCFSIFARDQDNHLFNGFEFRVKKICDMDVESFAQGAPASAIVSFMRRQIEENHWQAYRDDGAEKLNSNSPISAGARAEGCQAFLNKQHYRNNPYTDLNVSEHDEWDRGWAEAAQKNPGLFDFSIDSFV